MIWFTSDLHLGHRAAISMCDRPFEIIEEMNEILTQNFNSCVKKNDTVYTFCNLCNICFIRIVRAFAFIKASFGFGDGLLSNFDCLQIAGTVVNQIRHQHNMVIVSVQRIANLEIIPDIAGSHRGNIR